MAELPNDPRRDYPPSPAELEGVGEVGNVGEDMDPGDPTSIGVAPETMGVRSLGVAEMSSQDDSVDDKLLPAGPDDPRHQVAAAEQPVVDEPDGDAFDVI